MGFSSSHEQMCLAPDDVALFARAADAPRGCHGPGAQKWGTVGRTDAGLVKFQMSEPV